MFVNYKLLKVKTNSQRITKHSWHPPFFFFFWQMTEYESATLKEGRGTSSARAKSRLPPTHPLAGGLVGDPGPHPSQMKW